ncbi:MAG: LysM peptidoglycan-binding domain-containing protein, partial [Acetobacteraceae bacterium]
PPAVTARPAATRIAPPRIAATRAVLPRITPIRIALARITPAPVSARARLAMTTRALPALAHGPSAPSPTIAPAPAVRRITVQPGQTLWQIAQQTYGNGALYMRIFRANRAQLSRPGQIRPGQVLRLPMGPGRARAG